MKSLAVRAAVYGLLIVLGLLSALPNVLPDHLANKLPDWYSQNTLTLGLDLRGGSHLLLEVDTQTLLLDENQRFADRFSDELSRRGFAHAHPEVSLQHIVLRPNAGTQIDSFAEAVRNLLQADRATAQNYMANRYETTMRLRPTADYIKALNADAVERSLEVVRGRLDETGLVDPSITRQGDDGVLVQLPGVDNPGQIRKLLGTTAKMTFHWAVNAQWPADGLLMSVPGQIAGEQYRLERQVALEGKHISDAQLAFNQDTGQPVVNFKLDKEGARQFGDMTSENLGRALAVVLDGKVITAPVIQSVIAGGSGEISGSFTSSEANELALLLRAGALPAPLKVIEERTVGPDLGSDSIAMGLSTGVMGTLLVFGFMLIIYGRWGVISCVALAVNIGLIFGILSLLGATLTLPGIAGIILSIGMAVDANILINERIREELAAGRSAFSALNAGFKRALATIVDSNITTLIAISLLFMFGSGPVKGFAVTMAIGLLTSMFTAVGVTRAFMEWRVSRLGAQPLRISGFRGIGSNGSRTPDVLRYRRAGLVLSAVLSLAAILLFINPGLNYGIDFKGGTVVEVQAPNASIQDLRTTLQQQNFAQAAIQEVDESDRFMIRLPMENAAQVASGEQIDQLKKAVQSVSDQAQFHRVEIVGPKVSGNFADATILAVLLAGVGMLAYLWLRFESHFAVAATLTLALDVTKTIGFFALAGIEFNLTAVAALLALIGYSINDKVVVFDRVRENLRLMPEAPLAEVLNQSIASTLTRTVFTSVTTLLALLPMAVAGGSAVASFAQPLLFGIIIGTSSSIFIAAPLLLWLGNRRANQGLQQLRPTEDQRRAELDLIP